MNAKENCAEEEI